MEENIKTLIKVVITGPESTGKTTLTQALAKHFNTDFVPEFARTYLQQKEGHYSKDDLLKIAKGQLQLEEEHLLEKPSLLICDTSLEVIKVWSKWKYGSCDPFILEQSHKRIPHLFLLMTPDISWEPDPLRENPDDREALFAYYQKSLSDYPAKTVVIRGTSSERLQSATEEIQNII